MKSLVVATGNPGKLSEIRDLLDGLGIHLQSLENFKNLEPAVEDQPTLEGNAVKKARVVFEATGLAAIADDTGEVRGYDRRGPSWAPRLPGHDGAIHGEPAGHRRMRASASRLQRFWFDDV